MLIQKRRVPIQLIADQFSGLQYVKMSHDSDNVCYYHPCELVDWKDTVEGLVVFQALERPRIAGIQPLLDGLARGRGDIIIWAFWGDNEA
jgi:hypothetical protein